MQAVLYEVKIRLTSSWLGSQNTKDRVRRFRRDKNGRMVVDLAQWHWAFKQAAEALHMEDVDTTTIYPQDNIVFPTLVLYRRNYTHNNKQQSEMFEAIRENTVLTFNVLVTGAHGTGSGHQPDEARLQDILRFTGMFTGLSPWGGSYGYGRFDVEAVTRK